MQVRILRSTGGTSRVRAVSVFLARPALTVRGPEASIFRTTGSTGFLFLSEGIADQSGELSPRARGR